MSGYKGLGTHGDHLATKRASRGEFRERSAGGSERRHGRVRSLIFGPHPGVRGLVVSEIISRFWPQGDPARLRKASADWATAATMIGEVGDYGRDQTIKITAACRGSAIDRFQANWAKTGRAITALSKAAGQISSACSVYATEIDKLRSRLQQLAEIAGGVAVGSVALTFLTIGISDALGAVSEAAILAEAAAAAAAMTAELSASADVAVLAEAAEIVDQAAAAMIPVAATAASFSGGGGLGTATLASYTAAVPPGPAVAYAGPVGPIPPPTPQVFPNLSPAEQAEFRQWMAQMQADGHTEPAYTPNPGVGPKTNAERAYQIRVAGRTEYQLYTTVHKKDTAKNKDLPGDERDEATMWADGVRPQDGAAIDAKYVNNPNAESCQSLYNIGNVSKVPDVVYSSAVGEQQYEMLRYASAVTDPRNHVNHVEVDTNDNRAAAYFQALMWMNSVPGQVRTVP